MLTTATMDPTKTGGDAEFLERGLRRLIVGQGAAIQEIVGAYQLYRTGLSAPNRPIANFLFLGPTGCGKTRVVEAMAECLAQGPKAVIKIDCAEFQHSHEIAKLVGSPPGYLGHRETHALLSQESINRYHTDAVKISFILFDEIEKASDSLWNLLLGILDKGVLTLGDNRRVDFSQAMIFMTGNLGAAEMNTILSPRLGFNLAGSRPRTNPSIVDEKLSDKLSRIGIEAARRKFTPEFINRLDRIVVFKPLGTSELRRIADLELEIVQQRVLSMPNGPDFLFNISESGKQFLLEQGADQRYGARHLKRAIERLVVQPLSNLIASEQIRGGDRISIGHVADSPVLSFHRIDEQPSTREIEQLASYAGSSAVNSRAMGKRSRLDAA